MVSKSFNHFFSSAMDMSEDSVLWLTSSDTDGNSDRDEMLSDNITVKIF